MAIKFKNPFAREKKEGEVKNEISDNPYLQSRKIWQDLYGNAENRYKWSRRINLLLGFGLVVSIFGLISLGGESKIVPYVILMRNNEVIATGATVQSKFDSMRPQLGQYFLQQFITNMRSVSVDGNIAKQNMITAYALSKGDATKQLKDYFDKGNKYILAQSETVSIQIYYINKLPNNVYEAGWAEDTKDIKTNQDLGIKKYVGQFTYDWGGTPTNSIIFQYNPFGFYVLTISIAPVMG